MRLLCPPSFSVRDNLTRAAACLLMIAAGASFATAQSAPTLPLPDRLSDAEFWRLVTESSESGGSFPSDNWTSNEMTYPTIISRMRMAGDTAGAYLGVGPEQNFSYIASLHPRIAFLVDIRRQSVIQHLMYKAIFELSNDRADFVSMLFAKPRPVGLSTTSSIADIWEGFWPVYTDSALYHRNMERIITHLRTTHGFALDSADVKSLRAVYKEFVDLGPRINYAGIGNGPAGSITVIRSTSPVQMTVQKLGGVFTASPVPSLVAGSATADSTRATITGVVREQGTGAPVAGVTVRVASMSTTTITNDSGAYRLMGLPAGGTISLDVSRVGYGLTRVDVRLDQPLVAQDLTLARAPITIVSMSSSAAMGVSTISSNNATTTYYQGVNFAALTAALDSAGVPRSFLATEANYRYMKDLDTRNLFIPIVGDFAGPKAIRSVGDYLRAHGTTLTAFYVSNVEDYLFRNQVWRAFYANAATLPVTPTSVFIRSGATTCPMAAFLAGVAAGRVTGVVDATRCNY